MLVIVVCVLLMKLFRLWLCMLVCIIMWWLLLLWLIWFGFLLIVMCVIDDSGIISFDGVVIGSDVN